MCARFIIKTLRFRCQILLCKINTSSKVKQLSLSRSIMQHLNSSSNFTFTLVMCWSIVCIATFDSQSFLLVSTILVLAIVLKMMVLLWTSTSLVNCVSNWFVTSLAFILRAYWLSYLTSLKPWLFTNLCFKLSNFTFITSHVPSGNMMIFLFLITTICCWYEKNQL